MKAILVIDVPTLDDGRHLCNECPLWNRDFLLCEYDFNMEAKGCPLKPLPNIKTEEAIKLANMINPKATFQEFANGWNACLKEIEK